MSRYGRTSRVSASAELVDAFRRASGDASPLHVDASYARRTPFGHPVAHGVLGLLIALAGLEDRPGMRLARLSARFPGPIFPGQEYTRVIEQDAADRVEVRIVDGSRPLLEVRAAFTPAAALAPAGDVLPHRAGTPPALPRETEGPVFPEDGPVRDLAIDDIVVGESFGAGYEPRWARLRTLVDDLGLRGKGIDAEGVAVLAWASWLTGMEVPGRSALLSRVTVDFTPRQPSQSGPQSQFDAHAEVTRRVPRFGLVRLKGTVRTAVSGAQVSISAFARARSRPASRQWLTQLSPTAERLTGRVAFVVGGSRGLGAAISQALALQGCTVYVGFQHSFPEVGAMRDALGPAGGRVHSIAGDAADPAWSRQAREHIVGESGRLDFLVLSACPPLQPLGLDSAATERAADYVAHSLKLVHGPFSACAADLAAAAGQVVLLSSAVVDRPVVGWSHYISAKHAVEGLAHAAAEEYPAVSFLTVRPERLATDFAATPTSTASARPVEPVAAAIVQSMATGSRPGHVAVLDRFPHATERAEAPSGEEAKTAAERRPGTALDRAAADTAPCPPDRRGRTTAPAAPEPATSPENRHNRGVIALAATFTASAQREVLTYWNTALALGLDVVLTSYGQVFQALLDPVGEFGTNQHGCNVVLLRLEDWPVGEDGERTVDEFGRAVVTHTSRARVPLLVCFCPPSPPVLAQPRRARELARFENRLVNSLAGTRGLHMVRSDQWSDGYRVDQYHDARREELAHIPYTPLASTALGTTVMRWVHGLLAASAKVLVLDCDNTLWRGVCGEDGPHGVRVDQAARSVQQWAADLQARGVLICLCSKNKEADVDAVFRERPDMVLRPEHLTARRINWDSKADNLRALAAELSLSLEAFVFLDDNPVEVAEVAAACPGVLALLLPPDAAEVPAFLDRVWAFPTAEVTAEDRQRTEFYRSRLARNRLRSSATTFADFIHGLGLDVHVSEAVPAQLARAAQLTHRTNQFNLSTVRRTESELRALLDDRHTRCWVARARDRFGDHGLIGVGIARLENEVANLDTFLLSCRVLGRGVEHEFLAHLGRSLVADGARTVEATYRPTAKNTPVKQFFDAVAAPYADPHPGEEGQVVVYRIPAERMARIVFRPEEVDKHHEVQQPTAQAVPLASGAVARRVTTLARIAHELDSVEMIDRLIRGGES